MHGEVRTSMMRLQTAQFVSLFFVALAMTTGFSHLLELPNKMSFSGTDYLTVQQIYRGWAWLGSVIFLAILSTFVLMVALRGRPAFSYAAAAFGAMVGTQVVFWAFTYPVNRITQNWTVLPENWMRLRTQWEYSHAASALLELLAVVFLILLTLRNES